MIELHGALSLIIINIGSVFLLFSAPRFGFSIRLRNCACRMPNSMQIHGTRALRSTGAGIVHCHIREIETSQRNTKPTATPLGRGKLLRTMLKMSKANQIVSRHHRTYVSMVSHCGNSFFFIFILDSIFALTSLLSKLEWVRMQIKCHD